MEKNAVDSIYHLASVFYDRSNICCQREMDDTVNEKINTRMQPEPLRGYWEEEREKNTDKYMYIRKKLLLYFINIYKYSINKIPF